MANDRKITDDPASFWDISELVPKRKSAYQTPPRRDTEAVEITAPPPRSHALFAMDAAHGSHGIPAGPLSNITAKEADVPPAPVTLMSATGTVMAGDVPLPERFVSATAETAVKEAPVPEARYTPVGSLLYEVRIYPHKNEYTYYAEFRRHAKKLAALEGRECPHVPFFSYMPQYSQLTRPQLGFYLWWRTCFRRGEGIDADYSYLLLYLYELINLGDAIDPKTGQETMLRLWLTYREKHPRLDVLVREWLVDYSLLYRLPPPPLPQKAFGELVMGCRLKEFYVSAAEHDVMCDAVLYFASNYDYKKSKFYRGEAVPHYDRVMRGAVMETLDHFARERAENAPRVGGFSTITRDLFAGAICAYPLKKRIEVDFASFSHTYELRYIITDVLKYTENALRAVLGVKSRLTVYEVSKELRARLDAYLAEALPEKRTQKRTAPAPVPAYEKRYDLPVRPISPDRAAAIEAASWQTTKRLVEAFAEPETAQKVIDFSEKHTPSADFSINYETVSTENTALSPVAHHVSAAPVGTAVLACGEHDDTPGGGHGVPDGAHANDTASLVGTGVLDGPFANKILPPTGTPFVTLKSTLATLAAFLPLCDPADRAAQRAFAGELGMMVDAVADKINTVAGDVLGDIILEDAGGCYRVIEDYRELLQEEGILP